MRDARFWIVLAAAVSFLAGTAAGLLFGRKDPSPPSTAWTAYADWLSDTFDLTPEREGAMRILVGQYATDLDNLRRLHEARFQAQLEPELRELHTRYEGYIRDHVLPASERARFDALSEPRDLVVVQ